MNEKLSIAVCPTEKNVEKIKKSTSSSVLMMQGPLEISANTKIYAILGNHKITNLLVYNQRLLSSLCRKRLHIISSNRYCSQFFKERSLEISLFVIIDPIPNGFELLQTSAPIAIASQPYTGSIILRFGHFRRASDSSWRSFF